MRTRVALVGVVVLAACGDNVTPYWGSGTRLQARVHVRDDGYEGLVGWRDVVSGSECGIGGTDTLCAPRLETVSSDPACRTVVSQGEITVPYVTAAGRAYQPTGGMGHGLVYFVMPNTGECVTFGFERDYWLVEEVPAETLAPWVIDHLDDDDHVHRKWSTDGAFEYVVDSDDHRQGGGNSRLRPIFDVIDSWHDQSGVWDTVVDLPCAIQPVNGTEELACVPAMARPRLLHRDATCSDAGVLVSPGVMGMNGSDLYNRLATEPYWQQLSPVTCVQLQGQAFERSRSIDNFRAAAVRLELR